MGTVLRQRGDESAALSRFGEAREMFGQMGMSWWAQKVEVDQTASSFSRG